MHTSGTTATPKPVELTYGNFLASALGSAVALGLDPAERWLCPMPLTHVGGLSVPIRSAIYATTAVLHGRFDTRAGPERADGPGATDHDRLAGADDALPAARRRTASGRRRSAGRCSEAARSPPRCSGARAGCGGAGRAHVRDDRGVLADRDVRVAAAGGRGPTSRAPNGRSLVRGPIVAPGRARERRLAAHGRPGRASTSARGLTIAGRKSDTIVTGGENVVAGRGRGRAARASGGRRRRRVRATRPRVGGGGVAAVVLGDGTPPIPRRCGHSAPTGWPASRSRRRSSSSTRLPRTESGKILRRELA